MAASFKALPQQLTLTRSFARCYSVSAESIPAAKK
ncbi:hypothetical protein BN1708_001868, partial [Verticillium longisporum]